MTQINKKDFIHQETIYNFTAAKEVVPFIINLLKPKSIIDVGCGIGTWLKVFQENGIDDILGIDGHYINKENLKINSSFFKPYNLEDEFVLNRKFDLTTSLEVAEHLNSNSADQFVKSLCQLSDTIIFSAAIENQGGQDHINEQCPDYWINKFKDNDFELFDVIRPVIWENNKIDYWYRQNIMLFTKDKTVKEHISKMTSFNGAYLVHPVAFLRSNKSVLNLNNELETIKNGNKRIKFYLKLILIKLYLYKQKQ
jgi:SAM-dependent methyltransferase